MGVTAKKWVLANKISGQPTLDDFKIVTEKLPAVENGGERIYCKCYFLSSLLSPRVFMKLYQIILCLVKKHTNLDEVKMPSICTSPSRFRKEGPASVPKASMKR